MTRSRIRASGMVAGAIAGARDLVACGGAIAIVRGVHEIFPPAAWIVGGAIALTIAWAWARRA